MSSPASVAASRLAQRTSLSVDQDLIEDLTGTVEASWDDAISTVLGRSSTTDEPPLDDDADEDGGDWTTPVEWWIDQMAGKSSGLTDRMAWFWHNLLTTNVNKLSSSRFLADQLHLLRTEGRGNFRTLLHGFVAGAALQEYLDGSYSEASNPNENLGRELMELFTIGPGPADQPNYTEDDVKAAARALAGWVVDEGNISFDRRNAFIAPLIYLGEQDRWDTTKVVDRLCDHPATAQRVAGRLWQHLVGAELADEDRQELGRWWAEADLEIEPLLERILASPAFRQPENVRARSGLEWYCAARSATGADGETSWSLWGIGQMPYHPPNVAGWRAEKANGQAWLGAGSMLGRVASIWGMLDSGGIFEESSSAPHSTDGVLAACGIASPSPSTRKALDNVGTGADAADLNTDSIRQVRWRLALASPEFSLL